MDPNYVFPDGNRPLHYAASLGLIEVVVWLVKNGANIHTLNGWNQTALDMARLCKKGRVVRFLEKIYALRLLREYNLRIHQK